MDPVNHTSSKIIEFVPRSKREAVQSGDLHPADSSSVDTRDALRLQSLPPQIFNKEIFQADLQNFLQRPSSGHDLDKLIQSCVDDGSKLLPNADNLKSIKLETSANDLILNISTDHLKQGYLQVLSDLNLVAKFVDSKVQDPKDIENIFKSLKVVSHPDRNLVLTLDQLAQNRSYEFGPEIKFVQFPKQKSYLPYLVGPPRLEDVEVGAYSIDQKNKQNFLQEIALSPKNLDTFNPLTDVLTVRKPVLGVDGKFKIAFRNHTDKTDMMLFNDFGYHQHSEKLEDILRANGGMYAHFMPLLQPPTLHNSVLHPPWSPAIREMIQYEPTPGKEERDLSVTGMEQLAHPVIQNLARQDALLVAEQAITPRIMKGGFFAPLFALETLRSRS